MVGGGELTGARPGWGGGAGALKKDRVRQRAPGGSGLRRSGLWGRGLRRRGDDAGLRGGAGAAGLKRRGRWRP